MVVYHCTGPIQAQAILEGGFKDRTDYYMTDQLHTGVWVADQPITEGFPASILRLDVPEAEISEYEWTELPSDRSWREWLVPAEILNRHTIELMGAN